MGAPVLINGTWYNALVATLPPGAALPAATGAAGLLALSPDVRAVHIDGFTAALQHVFVDAAVAAAIGFVVSWFLKELPLQDLARSESVAESFAMPTDATSLDELEWIVDPLSRRENRWEVFRRVAEASDVRLAPDAIWLLARICLAGTSTNPAQLVHEYKISEIKLREIGRRLMDAGLVTYPVGSALIASAQGRKAFDTLSRAREARLGKMLEKWTHEQRAEIMALLDRLSRSLMAELPIEPRALAAE